MYKNLLLILMMFIISCGEGPGKPMYCPTVGEIYHELGFDKNLLLITTKHWSTADRTDSAGYFLFFGSYKSEVKRESGILFSFKGPDGGILITSTQWGLFKFFIDEKFQKPFIRFKPRKKFRWFNQILRHNKAARAYVENIKNKSGNEILAYFEIMMIEVYMSPEDFKDAIVPVGSKIYFK